MNKKPTDDNGDQVSITSQEKSLDDNGDSPIPPGRPEVIKKPAAPLLDPKGSDKAHMDATRLYLSEIGSPSCSPQKKRSPCRGRLRKERCKPGNA